MGSEEAPDRPPSDRPEVDLSPHPLVPGREQLDAQAGEESLTTIVGFVGPSRSEDRVRVYLDLSFSSYFDVAAADVVQTARVDANDENSPTIVWVGSSAQVGLVRIGRLTGDASFVTGAIRQRHGRGARSARAMTLAASMDPCTDWFDCIPKPVPPDPTSWECFSNSIPCPEPTGMFC